MADSRLYFPIRNRISRKDKKVKKSLKLFILFVVLIIALTACKQEPKEYKVGDVGPGGGLVFYDCDADNGYGNGDGLKSSECGWRYLEAAPWDIFQEAVWGDNGEYGTQTGIGTGITNTAIIVSKASNSRKPNAATLCDNYTCGYYTCGESDYWFLPSKDELNLMYVNLHKNGWGGFANDGYYWSSSETYNDTDDAWMQSFDNGNQYSIGFRNFNCRVRPVRAFYQ